MNRVKICYHMEDKAFYAMKILKKGFSLNELKNFISEVEILGKLNDRSCYAPKLIDANFRGDYNRPGHQPTKICYYVMELAEYGELFELIKNGAPLSEDCIRFLFHRILKGREQLHTIGVFHRDIKCENILIDKNFDVKLCDFGSSTEEKQSQLRSITLRAGKSEVFGTLAYNAPETFLETSSEQRQFDKCDIFSLGCVLFLMTFRQHPFKQANREDPFYRQILMGNSDAFWKMFETKVSISNHLKGKTGLQDLLFKMLNRSPDERVSITQILHHPWMLTKPLSSYSSIAEEMRINYTEISSKFIEKSLKELEEKDWKRFRGFTARRSRPGSACDFQKDISEFILVHEIELSNLLNKFKRPLVRKSPKMDFTEERQDPSTPKKPFAKKIREPYSVTKMLRKYSSSSSSETSLY